MLENRLKRTVAAGSMVVVTGLLAGCSSMVDVEPAPDANNPACADAMVFLPDTVSDYERRETTSQATAAWGDPAAIALRCGVTPPPSATTDACVDANGVDWIAQEGEDVWTLTTYGREPAIEVLFDPNKVPSSNVLPELAPSVQKIEAQSNCLSYENSTELPES
ncbi:DUF3515 domain-containing protein [Zhihengliuella flava]|uniref:DUF3515 domain-containing protein n=1 Tax=Zhihengliuella flava TaxID=1285193 RepID=A0A931D4G2_9MICC|nr:DUF3515 domain-containing protein [Zhihengliuella flava]MBG6083560.1 hypothetical protein [Zhihengliuella flava]